MASTYLSRATSSAGNQLKHTISFWFKRSSLSSNQTMIAASGDNSHANKRLYIFFSSGDFLYAKQFNGSGTDYELITNRTFRDTNAWYHCVIQYDAANSTANNRQRIWINGVEETSFSARTNPSTSTNSYLGGNGLNVYVGQDTNVSSRFFDGSISHLHYCDGYAYTASDFGSTDSTTGEWQINTSPSVSYGTTGFTILKDGNTITDQSSNSNNFTVGGGTLTFTHDNPSNVFATLNSRSSAKIGTYLNGNTTCGTASDSKKAFSTFGSKAGYVELKLQASPNGSTGKGIKFGVTDLENLVEKTTHIDTHRHYGTNLGYNTTYSVENFGGGNSWEGTSTGTGSANNDIIMVAWKNGKLYVGKGGTYFFSANPSNNTDGSTQVPLPNTTSHYGLSIRSDLEGATALKVNFGNGYFGSDAITTNSGNGYQDANGQGKFYYQPPTGCYALCTKNLNL